MADRCLRSGSLSQVISRRLGPCRFTPVAPAELLMQGPSTRSVALAFLGILSPRACGHVGRRGGPGPVPWLWAGTVVPVFLGLFRSRDRSWL